ncbi:MAG: hypothetical protein ONB44_21530 [candidate division KSB1 bacterium]|nr:hypothetical protein [candidate division KSB1 bacterium]MDZ7304718.1 hypothetical protein [candidate division KSB1 bacterium]MDZ7312774.1 hypothetical protein [candidate division KSB1 bacterium]
MKKWIAICLAAMCAEASAQGFYDYRNKFLTPLPESEKTKWRFAHRLQSGWEYDSNIYESSARYTTSGSARFLLNTRGERRDERWQIHYAYAAALQAYSGHPNENKLSHDLDGQLGLRLWPWLQLSTNASATLKFYLENATDYGTTAGDLKAAALLPHRILANLRMETGQLDYAETDFYDFTFRGAEFSLRRALGASSSLEATMNRRVLRYQRRAFSYHEPQGLVQKSELQRDVLTTLRLTMTGGRKIVTQVTLEAQMNRSNSFGYDFRRVRACGLLGFRPHQRWMLRAAGALQNKRYRDDLSRLNLRDLDTEREQSNFVVLDLSRDLSAEISLVARVAFYDNESTVPSVFYRKTLYFAGLEVRL